MPNEDQRCRFNGYRMAVRIFCTCYPKDIFESKQQSVAKEVKNRQFCFDLRVSRTGRPIGPFSTANKELLPNWTPTNGSLPVDHVDFNTTL
ncbi:hypothetical protein JTB14_002638 [Gonioctena quinquepunctata]|nr:hypothetical protein JTB14_002638 [Gonioctena quinquepunctata]